MKTAPRLLLTAALAVLPLAAVIAQTPPSTPTPTPSAAPAPARVETAPATPSRRDPDIQRIRTEDAGSRIDELRVGGETKQILVQPKTTVPGYEIKPAEGSRGTPPPANNNDTNGSRVWNFFRF